MRGADVVMEEFSKQVTNELKSEYLETKTCKARENDEITGAGI